MILVIFTNYLYKPFARVLHLFLTKDVGPWPLDATRLGQEDDFKGDISSIYHSAHWWYMTLVQDSII